MKDIVDAVSEDLGLAVVTDVEPVVLCPEEEMAGIQECDYCGHAPCGCGG